MSEKPWPRFAVMSAGGPKYDYIVRSFHNDADTAHHEAQDVMAREDDEVVMVVEVLARSRREWANEIGKLAV